MATLTSQATSFSAFTRICDSRECSTSGYGGAYSSLGQGASKVLCLSDQIHRHKCRSVGSKHSHLSSSEGVGLTSRASARSTGLPGASALTSELWGSAASLAALAAVSPVSKKPLCCPPSPTPGGYLQVRSAVTTSRRARPAGSYGGDAAQRVARAETVVAVKKLEKLEKGGKQAGGGLGFRDPMEQLELERGVCNPFKKYSPEAVRARAVSSPSAVLGIFARGTKIVTSLAFYWAGLSYDHVVGRADEMVPKRAAELRNLLCDLGPSFIKAGQVLANRPDIIREDYMNELCILQDDVPAFPSQEAFAIMEKELGQPLEQVFSKVSPSPVAAASLGQVYRATLRETGEEVAIKVQRPGIEPVIYRDLFLFRTLASVFNGISLKKLGCNAELIVDEFGEKLLDELDYNAEARNIESFYENFYDDVTVKIPKVYRQLSGPQVLIMEWIDGIRCTNPQAIRDAGIDVPGFLTVGVSAALRQLLEFGLFHGDPHPGNIFAMQDGRIAYVDFGNVAELSQTNKQILIDAIVHAVNEDYLEMAGDFTRLGFLASGTDVTPLVPALEAIWQNSLGKGLADFNFRTVTGKFNQLVYNYPIRIPERFSLVIRSLLTQEGICLTLEPDFKFLEVAYPYVANRLLTDPDPALRERLIQVLFKDNIFQWKRLENLIQLAKEQVALSNSTGFSAREEATGVHDRSKRPGGLNLRGTIKDGARVMVTDAALRRQLLLAFTEDSRLHIQEIVDIYNLVAQELPPADLVTDIIGGIPSMSRDILVGWSERILSRR